VNYDQNKNYSNFFKEEIYGGFVQYLLDRYGAAAVIYRLRGLPLIGRKGMNFEFSRDFRIFLAKNPLIEKVFYKNDNKIIRLKNSEDGDLAFPIDTSDEKLMIREGLRIPEIIPVTDDILRASKEMKRNASFKNEIAVGPSHERKYLHPVRLTVHFKEGYARKHGKTTESHMIDSREDAKTIILDRYENKVAYATIQNKEEFAFVKSRNGKQKWSHKLHG